ncbi:rCG32220 [Rattus norvegicus]|uniref:RCG32220 n=1 Tax=Rattus norvegicus TaxID=10116 RepID=A6JXL7_RAT|nr:rCG32220 [Rattus norvegicus]
MWTCTYRNALCTLGRWELRVPEVRHSGLLRTGHRKHSRLAAVAQARPLQEAWKTPSCLRLCLWPML